ncbi:WD40 repeat domain-containing protein [Vairimorpha necatrix]|uniref:WD40 repeat domain-containing protein n=1 Tax=Vairimorpha necatrix TaxID=6039 RepID=A0AAX4JD13_9MICR
MHFYKNTSLKDLSHSVYKNPFLYFIRNGELYKQNLFKNSSELINKVETLNLLGLDFLGSDLIFIYKDKILYNSNSINHIYKRILFNFLPLFFMIFIIIKKYSIFGDLILIINNKNQLVGILKTVSYILSENIRDFTLDSQFIWVVDTNNKVYKKYFYTNMTSINLNNPLNIIKMDSEESIEFIEVNKNIFLFYKSSVEVYEISDKILILKYKYNTSDYKIYNCNKLYLVDKDTIVLKDYPSIIIRGRMECIYKDQDEDILLSKDQIIINSKEIKKDKNEKISYIPKIINNLDNLRTTFIIDSKDNKQILKKFDQEVLDKYRKFYYELITTNDSLILKKQKIDELYKKVNERILRQEKRKEELELRIEELSNKYKKILKKVKINGKDIYKYIEILRDEMKKERECIDEKDIRIMRIQRDLLIKKIYK